MPASHLAEQIGPNSQTKIIPGLRPTAGLKERWPRRPAPRQRRAGVDRSVPRGLSGRGGAAQPYREAVVGVLECDIDVELVDEP